MMMFLMMSMAGSVVYTGSIGAGNTTKLANQIIVALNIAAMSEALVLATKAGVEPELVYQAIRGGLAGSTVLDAKAPLVMDRKFDPGFRIELHIKDLANVLETAHEIGVPLPLTAGVMEIMQALKVDGKQGDEADQEGQPIAGPRREDGERPPSGGGEGDARGLQGQQVLGLLDDADHGVVAAGVAANRAQLALGEVGAQSRLYRLQVAGPAELAAPERNDAARTRELLVQVAVIQRGQQLAHRKVARAAEDNQVELIDRQ